MAFLLVFRGELEPVVNRKQSAAIIAEKLGKTAEFVEERLFIDRPVKVRAIDTMEEAERYVEIFREAGAKLEVHRAKRKAPEPDIPAPESHHMPDGEQPAGEPPAADVGRLYHVGQLGVHHLIRRAQPRPGNPQVSGAVGYVPSVQDRAADPAGRYRGQLLLIRRPFTDRSTRPG